MRLACSISVVVALSAWGQEKSTAVNRFDSFFRTGEQSSFQDIEKALDDAVKANPNDFEILWRAAYGKYWSADGSLDNKVKRDLAKEGWRLAEKAVALQPDRVEGHYAVAINIGMYSQSVGILRALGEGLEGKFLKHIDRAIALDASFDVAGPCVCKGRYFYELPWPFRSDEKARKMLESCIRLNSENLRARQYMVEVFVSEGKPVEAKKTADAALSASETYNPKEAQRVKERIRALLPKIEAKLK